MASPPSLGDEGQIITCRECGAPMAGGIIQSDGTIRFVCTRNLGHFSMFNRIISNISGRRDFSKKLNPSLR